MLNFSAAINPAFVSVAMERGVVEPVKGGEQGELVAYTFTTPYLTTIVVENKVSVSVFPAISTLKS